MTMKANMSRLRRIQNAKKALAEGRVIQKRWGYVERGRKMVCALAAFGLGDDIIEHGVLACPGTLMPSWVAGMVPHFDDSIPAESVPWLMKGLIDRVERWDILTRREWLELAVNLTVLASGQTKRNPWMSTGAEYQNLRAALEALRRAELNGSSEGHVRRQIAKAERLAFAGVREWLSCFVRPSEPTESILAVGTFFREVDRILERAEKRRSKPDLNIDLTKFGAEAIQPAQPATQPLVTPPTATPRKRATA